MKVLAYAGCEEIALVYVVEYGPNKVVECVESLQPPIPRHEKWVLLVSTMFGCPVGCQMCDAGGFYQGKLSKDEILAQIDFLVRKRYSDGIIPARNFKIQFARMGEPALNLSVLDVLDELPLRYQAPGLMPSLSTIAPLGSERFFARLLEIKRQKYPHGRFQFQYSLHTTDEKVRDQIIPVKKWDFARLASYGEQFYQPGDRKITLNFALAHGTPLDPRVLLSYFDPERYLVKITPLNPTHHAVDNGLTSYIDPQKIPESETSETVQALRQAGYQVIVSIGAVEENAIGSNCGQYVLRHMQAQAALQDAYSYTLQEYGD